MENPSEKPEKSPPLMVAVDGARIRAIREENKLTQLYVANVVGVTTDTISRWENNRYPSIKRENAEKLAAALEVELPAILKADEPPAAVSESSTAPDGKKGMRLTLLLLVIAITVALAAYILRHQAPQSTAERILPGFGAPGETIPVQIRILRKGEEQAGFIIKERLPEGWRLVTSSPASASGTIPSQEVKWLVPAGSGQATIRYAVKVGPDSPLKSVATFKGSIVSSADGLSRTDIIGGDRTMRIAGVHWADANGDGRIDDDEIMPAYYLVEEMKGLGLEWKTIEAIWNAGGYKWDPQKKAFVVLK
jgi:transcriptional regulator with XRE-family HTH domain